MKKDIQELSDFEQQPEQPANAPSGPLASAPAEAPNPVESSAAAPSSLLASAPAEASNPVAESSASVHEPESPRDPVESKVKPETQVDGMTEGNLQPQESAQSDPPSTEKEASATAEKSQVGIEVPEVKKAEAETSVTTEVEGEPLSTGHTDVSAKTSNAGQPSLQRPSIRDLQLFKVYMMLLDRQAPMRIAQTAPEKINVTLEEAVELSANPVFKEWHAKTCKWLSIAGPYSKRIACLPIFDAFRAHANRDVFVGQLLDMDLERDLQMWHDFLDAGIRHEHPDKSLMCDELHGMEDLCQNHPLWEQFLSICKGFRGDTPEEFLQWISNMWSCLTDQGNDNEEGEEEEMQQQEEELDADVSEEEGAEIETETKTHTPDADMDMDQKTSYRYPSPPTSSHPNINNILESTAQALRYIASWKVFNEQSTNVDWQQQ